MFQYLFKTYLVTPSDDQGQGRCRARVNFATPWARMDYIQIFKDTCGIAVDELKNGDELRAIIAEKGIIIEGSSIMGLTTLVDHIYKKLIRPSIVQPTILYNFPLYMQPLARKNTAHPNRVDQFQLIVNGWEILKKLPYSELVDPVDQEERFVEQAKAKEGGDEEAMDMEEDFIIAMEHGMPPISGWGMGIDRIVTLLSGQENLRDVVLYLCDRRNNVLFSLCHL